MEWLKFFACLFFGFFGIHKFIEKKPIWGIIYIFTCGLFGIGWIFDCVRYFIAALKNTTPKESSKKALFITPIVCIVLFIGMIISAAFSDTSVPSTTTSTASDNIVISSSQSISENNLSIPSKNFSSDFLSSEAELVSSSSSSSEAESSVSNNSISSEAETSSSSSSSSKAESSVSSEAVISSSSSLSSEAESYYSSSASSSKNSSSSASVIVPEESETGENLVWVPTNGGTKYHSKKSCSNMIDPIQITLENAQARGYTAYKHCH